MYCPTPPSNSTQPGLLADATGRGVYRFYMQTNTRSSKYAHRPRTGHHLQAALAPRYRSFCNVWRANHANTPRVVKPSKTNVMSFRRRESMSRAEAPKTAQ